MKIKVACFHRMGKPMGTKWAVFIEKQRFIQNIPEMDGGVFARGVLESPSFQGL